MYTGGLFYDLTSLETPLETPPGDRGLLEYIKKKRLHEYPPLMHFAPSSCVLHFCQFITINTIQHLLHSISMITSKCTPHTVTDQCLSVWLLQGKFTHVQATTRAEAFQHGQRVISRHLLVPCRCHLGIQGETFSIIYCLFHITGAVSLLVLWQCQAGFCQGSPKNPILVSGKGEVVLIYTEKQIAFIKVMGENKFDSSYFFLFFF